jgi:DNA-binding NarL/FixJ family response regulator
MNRLICGAAKVARQRLNLWSVTSQDREDITQAAALGSIKAKVKNDNESYEFRSALNEAMKFILSQVFERGATTRFEDYENYEGEPEFVNQFEINESKLADMFLAHRKKKGRRGYEASRRDARICKLILAGYGNVGIAQELGISEHNVRRYRTDIRDRLKKIAKEAR